MGCQGPCCGVPQELGTWPADRCLRRGPRDSQPLHRSRRRPMPRAHREAPQLSRYTMRPERPTHGCSSSNSTAPSSWTESPGAVSQSHVSEILDNAQPRSESRSTSNTFRYRPPARGRVIMVICWADTEDGMAREVPLDGSPFDDHTMDEDTPRDPSSPPGWEFLTDSSSETDGSSSSQGRGRRPRVWWVAGALTAIAVLAAVTVGAFFIGRPRIESPPASSAPPGSSSSLPAPRTTGGDTQTGSPTTATTPTGISTPSAVGSGDSGEETAAAALATLAVKGRAARTSYDRNAFGPDWADVDGNGWDTRNDILARDLRKASLRAGTDGCIVESGQLSDPYSGKVTHFERGWETSTDVQIDHVVALSNSWQTGAQFWTADKRQRFANDPLELLAVDGTLNQQKGDGDAATWLPPNKPYRCEYVARQIAVKAKYGLWVTPPEQDAMARILHACPGQDLPTP